MRRAATLVVILLPLLASGCTQGVPPQTSAPGVEATIAARAPATVAALPSAMPAPSVEPTATAWPTPLLTVTKVVPTNVPIAPTAAPNPTLTEYLKQHQISALMLYLQDAYMYEHSGSKSPLADLWDALANNGDPNAAIRQDQFHLLLRAQDGLTYMPGDAVLIGNRLIAGVEGLRLSDDRLSLAQGKYYLVIDFAMMNFSQETYLSTLSRFSLSDAYMYTYSPTLVADTVGDIEGVAAPQALRRGEVAFAVPSGRSVFTLSFDTGLSSAKTVSFKIDATSLLKGGLPLPQQ